MITKYAPLVLRNLGRNKLRSLLTGAAIALATALVCILRTMPVGLDQLLNSMAKNTRISVHSTAGVVYSMPYSYLARVRALPGVVGAVSFTWFGGTPDADKGVTFPSFATDVDQFGVVYDDQGVTPAQLAAFQRTRNGVLIGRATLTKYGWKVGDTITLQSLVFPLALELRIVGEIPEQRDPRVILQREYLLQALAAQGLSWDSAGVIWARVDDPSRVEPMMREVDAMFRNSEAETTSETEKSFFSNMFGNLQGYVTVLEVVTGLVALCIVFIAANTASMAVRERMREVAVLKAIGFGRRLLFGTLLAEATALSFAGGAAGVLASVGITKLLGGIGGGGGIGPLSGFLVSDAIVVQGLFLALFVGIVSGVIPSWGAARRSVVLTLREVF